MNRLYLILFFSVLSLDVTSSSYNTEYAEPNCRRHSNIEFPLGSKGESTAFIIKPQEQNRYGDDNDCNITVSANKAKGHVMLNVKLIDFDNVFGCKNYLEIFSGAASLAKLCENRGSNMYFTNARADYMKFHYHTDTGSIFHSGFKIIATAYTDGPCKGNFKFRCKNNNCISNDLTCDGYDNCGDGSDETYDDPARCRLGAGAVAGIVIGVLLLIALVSGVVWCCQRKRSRVTRTVYNTPAPMANPIAQQSYQQPTGGIQNPYYGVPYPQPPPPPYQK